VHQVTTCDVKGPGHTGLSASAPILALAAEPFVAAVLGVLLGAALLALTAAGVRMFTPETLVVGMLRALAMMLLGLVLGVGGLFFYSIFAHRGLLPFGLGLIAGFMIPALIALFRFSGMASSSAARR
jgi:hypothetical protein